MNVRNRVFLWMMCISLAGGSCQHNGSAGNQSQESTEPTEESRIGRLKKELRATPDSLPLRMELAARLRAEGEFRAALRQLDTILKADSLNPRLHLYRGELLLEMKDTLQATASYENAHRLAPESDALYSLAYLYASAGNEKTLPLCDTIIRKMTKQHPKGDAYYIKGIYYLARNNSTEALRAFNQSINIDHTFMESYTEKGGILFKEGKYKEAMKVFQLAATVSNSYPDAYYWQGRCLEALGEAATAAVQYKKAIALSPDYKAPREALQKLSN